MSNIEDIENVRSFLFELKDGTKLKLVEKENYDKLVKIIKELEVLEEDLRDKRIAYIDTPEFEQNYIPKQKVKDKIEELKKHYNTDNNIRIYTLKDSYELQATVLEELLEEK